MTFIARSKSPIERSAESRRGAAGWLRAAAIAALIAAPGAFAADAPEKTQDTSKVPEPPPLPENYHPPEVPDPEAQALEPEVRITTRGAEIHEEYRLHGKLYMIKVTPTRGKAYYLIDHEGSGVFRRSELQPAVMIPHWVIREF